CPAVGSTCADTMADMNIPVNDAPTEQAPAPRRNPIFPIDVALLKNTNFFRAFTTSFTIPAIYIQKFWDTMCFNSSTGLYSCQLDEQWFNLHKDILKYALDISLADDNNPFMALPSSDIVIEQKLLDMTGQDQDNQCFRFFWVSFIAQQSIMQRKSIWEELFNPITYVFTDRKNLATAARGKKKTAYLLIPSVRQTARSLTTQGKAKATEKPVMWSQRRNENTWLRKYPGDEPSPAKRSKGGLVGKRRKPKSPLKFVDEPSDEGVPTKEPTHTDEEADLQPALELSLKEQAERT
ncbi:retrovirus-related pol polyprotein from transposon TNT 1-94, partial [Tanacetum coccineum]